MRSVSAYRTRNSTWVTGAVTEASRLLLAVWHPDVLDLRRLSQKLASFSVPGIEPVTAIPRRPCPLHVHGGRLFDHFHTFAAAEVPHGLHVIVLGEHARKCVFRPGHNIDDSAGHVGRLEHAIEVSGGERVWLRRDRDCRISHRDRGGNERHKAEQRMLIGTRDADDANRLVHREGNAANRHVMYGAVVFVRPRRVGKEPRDRDVDFARCFVLTAADLLRDAPRKLIGASRQILGDVIQNLGAQMASRLPPTFPRRVSGLDGVANVLAIPFTDLADDVAVRRQDATCVALVGTRLLPTDEQLGRSVDRRGDGWPFPTVRLRGDAADISPLGLARLHCLRGLYVLPHPLASTLASKPAFSVTAET